MENSQKQANVTIREVSERAGVSIATASRALSGRGYVSEKTRLLVLEAAHDLGYTPNVTARNLKLQRTNTIGLMITDVVNPFYAYLAHGALMCAQQSGYQMILCATNENPDMEREYIDLLIKDRVAGIVAVPTGKNVDLWRKAQEYGLKIVLVDREIDDFEAEHLVVIDNYKGAYDAARYLAQIGHKRIGIITGPQNSTTGRDRLRGYQQALADAGIAIDDALIQTTSFKYESGLQAAHRLLSLTQPPSAIFAANNVLGEATLVAMRERNLRVPEDVSLVMFDDVRWASLTKPRLTVVTQPIESLGFISVELLDRSLKREDNPDNNGYDRRTVLQPQLTIRESCITYAES